MGTASTVVAEKAANVALILANAGEILGPDSPYDQGRRALQREVAPIIEASKLIVVIDSADDAEKATQFGRLLQVASKERVEYFKAVKVKIDDIKKPILANEKEDIGAIDTEKSRLGNMLTRYDEKVRRETEEANRLAREEAERQAREDQLNRAIEAEESGDHEQRDAVLEEEVYVPPVAMQVQSPPKIAGKVGKTTYSASVEDWEGDMMSKPESDKGWRNFRILVKAVAEGKAPLRALLPNESFIGGQGRDYKEGFSMPGCKLKKNISTSFRG